MADESLRQPLTQRFSEALTLACELHRTQARKDTQIPYVAHLLAVAALALEHGATEDEAIAALLHDAVEDQGGAAVAARIRAAFGDGVADIVIGCSDTDVVPKPPWRARKEAYIAHVRTAAEPVRLVSACDKLHNARSILDAHRVVGEQVWTRFKGGKDGTLWYYRSLIHELRAADTTKRTAALVDELERVVAELETLSTSRA